jgi:hypothetical protein
MFEPKRKLSTRLLHKGALVEETYTAFRHWDRSSSFRENIDRIRRTNIIGAKNEGWLTENLKTISSRFANDENLESLVILAQGGIAIPIWKACFLWHIGMVDELYYRFATEWLFDQYQGGVYWVHNEDPLPVVKRITGGKTTSGAALSDYGAKTAATDLLRMAVAFDLMEGRVKRKFRTYHLPQEAFVYVLHGLSGQGLNTSRIIASPDWRLFLMAPDDVERELLRLHQYKVLEYEVAGSMAALRLPYGSLVQYARSLTT